MEWIEEADGVFRGGGVKGLGLAGALLGFAEHQEKPVKKWVNVAGASAGAIIACYPPPYIDELHEGVRTIRNAIQHAEERLEGGIIGQGDPVFLSVGSDGISFAGETFFTPSWPP